MVWQDVAFIVVGIGFLVVWLVVMPRIGCGCKGDDRPVDPLPPIISGESDVKNWTRRDEGT
jgi:hypothetical protein